MAESLLRQHSSKAGCPCLASVPTTSHHVNHIHLCCNADITLAEVSVITQLATSAVLWPSTKPALLDRRLPWKLFSQLLVEILWLPIINTAPFNEDRLILPTKGCLQLDDLIPDAMCLLSALTGTFLNAMRLQGKEPEHFKDYILPLVMTTLQKHYQQPWGGILVMLLASFMGQLGRGVILKLKKEVPQESFQDAVWTGRPFWPAPDPCIFNVSGLSDTQAAYYWPTHANASA